MAYSNRQVVFPALFLMVPLALVLGCDGDGSGGEGCPDVMVEIDAEGAAYCIDATELTNSAYALFLNEHGNACGDHECMHTDEPGARIHTEDAADGGGETWVVEAGFEDHPVVQVTFHGALEACESLGRVLCPEEVWRAACGGPAGGVYPYGDDYSPDACNGKVGSEDGAPVAVGSMAGCEGGVGGLFDMSGNVYEWADTCAAGPCNILGGSYDRSGDGLTCDETHEMDGPSGHREDLGLRCCVER